MVVFIDVTSVLSVVGLLAVGSLFVAWLFQALLLAYLKAEHHQQWLAMGSPFPFLPALRSESRVKVGRFVWGGEYRHAEDSRTRELAQISRVAAVTFLVLFLVWVAIFFAGRWLAA